MSAFASRRARRAFERRADRLFDGLRGACIPCDASVSHKTHVVVAFEGAQPILLERRVAVAELEAVGFELGPIGKILEAMASEDDGRHLPCLIVLEEGIEITWVKGQLLTGGGSA